MQDEGAALYHLIHRLGKVFRRIDADSGVPSAQLSALVTVVMHDAMPMSELARYELVAPQTITRVVDDLESSGLVRRADDPADRRRTLVTATSRGRGIATAARQRKIEFVGDYLAGLPSADRRALTRATELLAPMLEREVTTHDS